ncbi:xanthine dehydrogenase accessory protein XdhC [Martelella soudanensis]|uniref:xanthine dehydrogenase accessory protein XdhC n=1 Tax=unclassified Martelella TaxID=2629616 RepID=UPI0015DFF569|nr:MULTISPECIES: xanthine dehydrogenase accessory protein XdhC [unclassified Martelella]
MDETEKYRRFIAEHGRSVIVTVAAIKGSTPREAGAAIVVSDDATCGTIGGGQLEFLAIDHARALLGGRVTETRLDIALGPEIGQCCGGRTELAFETADRQTVQAFLARLAAESAREPHVFIFGGGHVGSALATALAPLPFNTAIVETRPEMVEALPDGVELRLSPMPEAEIANIPAGGAAVILTHDHALDFLIATEALKRDDLCYRGMIGSKTKRATYRRYAREQGLSEAALSRLTMPIGGMAVSDKRPAVIAALVATELIVVMSAAKAGIVPTGDATR